MTDLSCCFHFQKKTTRRGLLCRGFSRRDVLGGETVFYYEKNGKITEKCLQNPDMHGILYGHSGREFKNIKIKVKMIHLKV